MERETSWNFIFSINMKGLLHHLPTDEDIANILKEFTVDFLLKGYGTLVNDLHSQLLANIHIQIDTSHFFWLVTYFLKFATQLELDPEHISPVLSYEILSYLIFQGVWVYEELEISFKIPDIDLKPCLRRLHLVVTAIREFLQGVEAYHKMIHLSDTDKDHLANLQKQIGEMENLKMLFVLLLRQYNPNLQSRQYLQDLILTNHNFLLFLENYSSVQNQDFNLVNHLKRFATVDIMRQYGLLLESFKENGEFVNNCIFTMMHHIGGDLQNVSSLFQPSILKTFSQIWDTDYELCDDWSDLIEYVIHKFIHTPTSHRVETVKTPVTIENSHKILKEIDNLSDTEYSQSEWTREEKDNLLKYYNQSRESSDTIAKITEKYEESGMRYKTQLSVIHELLDQNIITEKEYNDLTKHNKIERTDSDEKIFENFSMENLKNDDVLIDHDIKVLREFLIKENKGKFLIWLQSSLLESCYAKLVLSSPDEFPDKKMEPIAYYFAMLNLPIPVIPWTSDQANILKHQPFVLLLHKLGFYLPADTGKIFVRIPNFWTADYIFSIAQQLGPIQPGKLKFSVNKLKSIRESYSPEIKPTIPATYFDSTRFSMIEVKQTPSVVRYTPLPNSPECFQNISITRSTSGTEDTAQNPSTRRLSIVIPDTEDISCNIRPPELSIMKRSSVFIQKDSHGNLECNHHLHESEIDLVDDLERNSNCDTASVASDLTRMCVSDEEDKVTLVLNKSEKRS